MRTILLPTDFSKNSRKAISYAIELYDTEACIFVLLHVYKVNDYEESSRLTPIPAPQVIEKAHQKKLLLLEEMANEFKSKLSNKQHHFEFEAANKPLVAAVREAIKKQNAELVVIGTHGHTGGSEVVYGSNTVDLMEEIQRCPVLAVPANFTFRPLKEIVLAHGFKAELIPNDLNFLIRLSRKFKAPIRILYIAEEGGLTKGQKQNKKWILNHFKEQKAEHTFHSLDFLSTPLGIYAFTESRGSDMIAFINKKHSLVENLLFDPLYKDLGHYSKIPVLVLHQP